MKKNADEPVDMAGAVKIMSGLLVAEALESGTLQEEQEIAVSGSAAGAGGMSAFLDRGEGSYPAGTLFDAMMMISANDACLALAEAVSGSAEGFVQAMNERARALFGRAGVRQPHWAQRRRPGDDGARGGSHRPRAGRARAGARSGQGVCRHPGAQRRP